MDLCDLRFDNPAEILKYNKQFFVWYFRSLRIVHSFVACLRVCLFVCLFVFTCTFGAEGEKKGNVKK